MGRDPYNFLEKDQMFQKFLCWIGYHSSRDDDWEELVRWHGIYYRCNHCKHVRY